MTPSLLETFSPPPPPFPTASSFGTLVGGAHLMMSYLNKHFEPVPILCAVDFCLESRPVNPIVYLVKKSESGIQKYLLYLFYLFRMCSMWQSGYLLVDDLRVLWCFCKALPQNTIIMSYFAWPPTPVSTLASSCVIFPQTSGWHLLMASYLYVPLVNIHIYRYLLSFISTQFFWRHTSKELEDTNHVFISPNYPQNEPFWLIPCHAD